jgi:pimeloyl-ACP methyl ester carboxylesterase
VHLVGFSMGGYVAIELLATRPTRFTAALLMSTSCLPDSAQSAAGREKAIAAFNADFETTVQGVALRGLAQPNPSLQGSLFEMMRNVGAATAIRQTQAISRRTDHQTALGVLKLPVHVMCGRQDRITLPAWSQTLADTIPASTLHWVDDAGHMLPLEHPLAVGAVLKQMLNCSE